MKYVYALLLVPSVFILAACSGSSGSSVPSLVIQTCYDVQLTYSGSNQTKNFCTTLENGGYNGLGVNRFMRFSLPSTSLVSIRAERTSGLNPADPDLILYRNGSTLNIAESTESNVESMSVTLGAGDYVVELTEYVYQASTDKVLPVKSVYLTDAKTDDVSIQVDSNCNAATEHTVSGVVTYDRVNHNGTRLDYTDITQEPVQQAVVELFCGTGIYDSTVTDASGNYSLNVPEGLSSFVRVRAQMKKTGSPSWDFSVVDNTKSGKPTYVMDSSSFTLSANKPNTDLHAASGWGSSSYTSTRVAAPFAILDSVRIAKQEMLDVAPFTNFPALNINWSPLNTTSRGDLTLGQIGTSFFNGTEIYLLGAEDNDTDEYDGHVIIHEWGHYFEHNFSRSDSIGGPHSSSDILDIRVAFSEGFGNAFASIATDNPLYIDTTGLDQASGFFLNMESNSCTNPGWYSECSVQSILYDLYDADNEGAGADTLSQGFLPMFTVLTNEQRTSAAFTSIFSFIQPLKNLRPTDSNQIDALTSAQQIDPVLDIYGDSETTNNPGATNQLPIFQAY